MGNPAHQFQDAVLGIVHETSPGGFTFRVRAADGAVRGCFWVGEGRGPSEAQLGRVWWAVTRMEEVKRLTVTVVRNEVLSHPDRYGLLEEDGRPVEWAAPSFEMSEAEYFDDFRLRSVEIEGDDPVYLRVTYATELDPEHGVPVLFCEGKPVEAFT